MEYIAWSPKGHIIFAQNQYDYNSVCMRPTCNNSKMDEGKNQLLNTSMICGTLEKVNIM